MVKRNLTFVAWSAEFRNTRPTTELLDRPTHHCHIVEMGNESYRLRHSSATNRPKIQNREERRDRETKTSMPELVM
ncbi:ATP-binding protein [Paraburkholderia nemoris]|uniref:ATP-binding protein n=1 Tax=Paraburkholderia nemoris TaxID=2793076 RepID=UPI0038BC751C